MFVKRYEDQLLGFAEKDHMERMKENLSGKFVLKDLEEPKQFLGIGL